MGYEDTDSENGTRILGIIDSLSAGYRLLARRPHLMALPILLDLLILALPRLSIQPLYQMLANWYTQSATIEGVGAETASMMTGIADVAETFGANSNLLGMLANNSLLHVPSLMAAMGGVVDQGMITLDDPGRVVGLTLAFSLMSVLLGVVYLELLARSLPIGNGVKQGTTGEFLTSVLRHTGRVLLFVVTVGLLLMLFFIPLSFGLGLIGMVSIGISSTLGLVAGFMTMVFFVYLYFAVPALIMDDLQVRPAIMQSMQLVRSNFLPTLGFFMLTNLIGLGLGLIFVQLAGRSLWGTLIAIPANAFIGTGLAIALLLFYRTRVLLMAETIAMFDRRT